MRWEPEAEALLKRVPFFVRRRVQKRVEEFAQARGKDLVTKSILLEAKAALRDKAAEAQEGFSVEACFGSSGCPHAVTSSSALLDRLEDILKAAGLTDFLRKKVGGPLKHHHQFRVALSECPNACAQVHIKDFGLLGRVEPVLTGECKLCGSCAEACEEEALRLEDRFPIIDPQRCLGCGACIKVCPTEALSPARKGYRVLVGGKLGRHPQLARELVPWATEEEVLRLLERVLAFYKAHNQKGERLGHLIQKVGWEHFKKFVLQGEEA